MPAPPGPVTLDDLIREDKLLWVYCCDCCHERDVNPATVPLPAETPVPVVGKRMKCSACGSRKVDTRPELYPGAWSQCASGCATSQSPEREHMVVGDGAEGLIAGLVHFHRLDLGLHSPNRRRIV